MSMLGEHYLQPDAPDAVLPEAEVLRCVRRWVPSAQAVTAVDESGGEARAYIVDEALVLKVQRPPQVRLSTSLAKEAYILNHLAAVAPALPVPRVLGYARESYLLEYNLQTRLPGVALARAALDPVARRDAIHAAGRVLRQLHALPQAPLRASAHFPTDHTAADFKARLGQYFDALDSKLAQAGRVWPLSLPFEAVRERSLAAVPDTVALTALHSNPGPTHVLVEAAAGRFSGLIDFADAYISHPALDLWRWRWAAEREAVLAGYTAEAPVSDDFARVWGAVSVLAGALLVVLSPEREAEAVADLQESLRRL